MLKALGATRLLWCLWFAALGISGIFFINSESQSEDISNHRVNFVSPDEFNYINSIKKEKNNKDPSANVPVNSVDHVVNKVNPEIQFANIDDYLSQFSSPLLMASDLQEKFDKEQVDYASANSAEKDLAYIFYQGEDWQQFSPQEINCKSTMCRVKLGLLDEQENNRLIQLITDEMMLKNINYSFALPVSLPAERFQYIYFIKGSLSGVLPEDN